MKGLGKAQPHHAIDSAAALEREARRYRIHADDPDASPSTRAVCAADAEGFELVARALRDLAGREMSRRADAVRR